MLTCAAVLFRVLDEGAVTPSPAVDAEATAHYPESALW